MNSIQKFNELHTSNEILFLDNALDLLSALALEKAGLRNKYEIQAILAEV